MKNRLVIVPGWGLGRGPLEPVAEALAAGFFDLPGYHGTPLLEDFDEAVDRLAAHLAPASSLMGWSLGSLLALASAARHPEKIRQLILIAGTASFVSRPHWPEGLPAGALTEFSSAARSDFASLLPRFVGHFNRGDRHAKTLTRTLLATAEHGLTAAVLASGLDWLREVDLQSVLPQVRCPVLLIHGACDPLILPAAASRLAGLLPAARLEMMEETAHAPFLSNPAAFLDLVRTFLK